MKNSWWLVYSVTAGVLVWSLWWLGVHDPAPLPGEVASKLRAANATIYIVSDDPLSVQQINIFGLFANQVPTVNCTEQTTVCDKLQLEEIPTIIIGKANLEVPGLQSLEEIQKLLQQLGLW